MEEEQDASKEYIKGFNEGYLIGKTDPDLAKSLLSVSGKDDDRSKGFQEGLKEREFEKIKEKQRLMERDRGMGRGG